MRDRRQAYESGLDAESFVAAWYEDEGWTVCARNWRGAGVEVDLVVQLAGAVRLVEVKARDTVDDAVEAVTPAKQRRLRRAGEVWLARHPDVSEIAFVVAAVGMRAGAWELEIWDDAF